MPRPRSTARVSRAAPALAAAPLLALLGPLLTAGCTTSSSAPPTSAPATTRPQAPPSAAPRGASDAVTPGQPPPDQGTTTQGTTTQGSPPEPGVAVPCGPYECRTFSSARAALAHLVSAADPRVLGIGEAHALQGKQHLRSTTQRFTEDLLPELAPRARGIVVELLAPNTTCHQETEEVRQEQSQVTQGQAETNQNQFITLGQRARSLGVVPYILRPSCEDFQTILAAGDDSVVVMLETIARLTAERVEQLLRARPSQPADSNAPDLSRPLVLAYGGALHNDLEPREGRESWSYGPRLDRLTRQAQLGRYVALNLIVPEFVQDTPSWRSFPWYAHQPRATSGEAATLMRLTPQRWVLFFATTAPATTGPATTGPAAAGPR